MELGFCVAHRHCSSTWVVSVVRDQIPTMPVGSNPHHASGIKSPPCQWDQIPTMPVPTVDAGLRIIRVSLAQGWRGWDLHLSALSGTLTGGSGAADGRLANAALEVPSSGSARPVGFGVTLATPRARLLTLSPCPGSGDRSVSQRRGVRWAHLNPEAAGPWYDVCF